MTTRSKRRQMVRQAERLVAQVQGSMALEGQGVSKSDVRRMVYRTVRELEKR